MHHVTGVKNIKGEFIMCKQYCFLIFLFFFIFVSGCTDKEEEKSQTLPRLSKEEVEGQRIIIESYKRNIEILNGSDPELEANYRKLIKQIEERLERNG